MILRVIFRYFLYLHLRVWTLYQKHTRKSVNLWRRLIEFFHHASFIIHHSSLAGVRGSVNMRHDNFTPTCKRVLTMPYRILYFRKSAHGFRVTFKQGSRPEDKIAGPVSKGFSSRSALICPRSRHEKISTGGMHGIFRGARFLQNQIPGGKIMKRLLISFGAGCAGGFVNSLVVWLFGVNGITAHFGVSISPAWTPAWLYPRIVWGGLWGLLFLLPFLNSRLFSKGALLSIFPTIVQLFIVFPYQAKKGVAGISLGAFTPVFVLLYNWVWGVTTSCVIRYSK